MLKFYYEEESAIPAEVKKFYKQGTLKIGGADKEVWLLQCEGAVPKIRHDEFRQTNIELEKKLKTANDALAAFGDLTPDEAKELAAKAEDIRAHKAKKPEEIEALVSERTKSIATAHAKEKETLKAERDKYYNELCEHRISSAVVEEANKVGLRASATLDITSRSRQVFTLKDGVVVALDKDGNTRVGEDGYTPLSISTWVAGLTKEAPHLFDPSAGAGGTGTRPGGTGKQRNPWAKETWNLTEQGQIQRKDAAMAERLKAEAGKK